jgi:hypothetical protein
LARLAFSGEGVFIGFVWHIHSILSAMTDPLSGVRAKLQRADKHFAELDEIRQDWLDADKGEIVHENHPEAREYVVICKRAPEPPPEIGVVVGEMMHSLRSCLDNLVYALAIHETKQNPPPCWKQLQFPILSNEADFNGRWKERLSVFSDTARAVMKELQPFKEHSLALSNHGLWIIHELDIIDKHRRLSVVGQQPRQVSIGGNIPLTVNYIHPGPLVDDAVLMRYGTDGSQDVQVQTEFAPDIAFYEPDVLPNYPFVAPLLGELRKLTGDIVNDFERILF